MNISNARMVAVLLNLLLLFVVQAKAQETKVKWFGHAAFSITTPNGKVLLTGGSATAGGASLISAELYTPSGNSFAATTGNMTTARKNHSATAMTFSDGSGIVLIAGGTFALLRAASA